MHEVFVQEYFLQVSLPLADSLPYIVTLHARASFTNRDKPNEHRDYGSGK